MSPRTSFFSKSSSSLCALLVLLSVMSIQAPATADGGGKKGFGPVQKLLDVSGLVWVGGDTFLAVHDAKIRKERKLTRVSLIQLPQSLDGLQWKPLKPRFPGRPSNDLESASRVPGTRKVLLVESGDDHSAHDRIFLARAGKRNVRIVDATHWSTFYDAGNIEATAVARTEDGLLFIWAERAQGESSTSVLWTDLELRPFRIGQSGEIGHANFALTDELAALYNRPLVGLDLTPDGEIYGVAAMDSDFDDGPWRSAIMRIGRLDGASIEIDEEPTVVGYVDGLKIESVALRPGDDGLEVFFGTDDEYYGGTLRQMILENE